MSHCYGKMLLYLWPKKQIFMNRDLHHIIMLGEMAGAVSTMITGTGMTPLG